MSRHSRFRPVESKRRLASDIYELNYLQRELERARDRHREALAALAASDDADRRVRLRDATFEDLSRLGLSATQSRRLIRLRDENALRSLDDLDEVPGIPSVLAQEVRSQLRD
jgi:DNA uptake protein ComE-like DNA-binding protein